MKLLLRCLTPIRINSNFSFHLVHVPHQPKRVVKNNITKK